MKLYTEEKIRKRLNSPMDGEVTIDEFIESLTPIELPSDDEIEEFVKNEIELEHPFAQYGFKYGVSWLKEKIQGGNK